MCDFIKNLINSKSDIWIVDDISYDYQKIKHQLYHLVRFDSLSESGTGFVLHFLLSPEDIVQFTDNENNKNDDLISYGRAFSIDKNNLLRLVSNAVIIDGFIIPIIKPIEFNQIFRRNTLIERQISNDINRILENAHPFKNEIELNDDSKQKRMIDGSIFKVHILNVGQGDMILIEFEDNKLWLIDSFCRDLIDFDSFINIREQEFAEFELEKVIISHFHTDHINKMPEIIEYLNPSKVIVACMQDKYISTARNAIRSASEFSTIEYLTSSSVIVNNDFMIHLIPTNLLCNDRFARKTDDPNHCGIIIVAVTAESSVILSGDVPGDMLDLLVSDYKCVRNKVNRFYKVAHHCSWTGDNDSFFEQYKPSFSVTSCGNKGLYNHPDHDTEEKLIRISNRYDGTYRDVNRDRIIFNVT